MTRTGRQMISVSGLIAAMTGKYCCDCVEITDDWSKVSHEKMDAKHDIVVFRRGHTIKCVLDKWQRGNKLVFYYFFFSSRSLKKHFTCDDYPYHLSVWKILCVRLRATLGSFERKILKVQSHLFFLLLHTHIIIVCVITKWKCLQSHTQFCPATPLFPSICYHGVFSNRSKVTQ